MKFIVGMQVCLCGVSSTMTRAEPCLRTQHAEQVSVCFCKLVLHPFFPVMTPCLSSGFHTVFHYVHLVIVLVLLDPQGLMWIPISTALPTAIHFSFQVLGH